MVWCGVLDRGVDCVFGTKSAPSGHVGITPRPGASFWQDLPPFVGDGAGDACHVGVSVVEQLEVAMAHVELESVNVAAVCFQVVGCEAVAEAIGLPFFFGSEAGA